MGVVGFFFSIMIFNYFGKGLRGESEEVGCGGGYLVLGWLVCDGVWLLGEVVWF